MKNFPASSNPRRIAKAAAHTGVDVSLALVGYGAGVFLTLLPQRYRRWLETRGGGHLTAVGIASGALQFLGCLSILLWRFFVFRQQRIDQWIADTGGGALGSTLGQFAVGSMTYLEYLTQPLTLVLLYFALEGGARMVAGVVTGEVVGTLPLQIVAWAHGKAETWWAERQLGPRIVDEVQEGDGTCCDLRILSCRPKTWDRMLTIVYEDVFYELAGEERGRPPRQFVYLLHKAPESKVIRGHHHYDPNESLLEK